MNLFPSTVTMDCIEPNVPCFLNPELKWNGYECPFFTKERAIEVLKAVAADSWTFSEEKDTFFVDLHDGGIPEEYAGTETAHGKLYGIGAYGWCWFHVDACEAKPAATPSISMKEFFDLPEVVRLQQVQKSNRYGSEAHRAAHVAMKALAATYGAEQFFGEY